jgi:hypothetical protein
VRRVSGLPIYISSRQISLSHSPGSVIGILESSASWTSTSLAKACSYHFSLKNYRDDHHIETGPLWRGKFLEFEWRGAEKGGRMPVKAQVGKVLI